MKIGIVNYSIGNVGSVCSAFTFYKYDARIITSPAELADTDVIVLAGVGHFRTAVSRLRERGFWDRLNEDVLVRKKPTLGICLGMQLFADVSYEDAENEGFGWIRGKVVRIDGTSRRVPNIGWSDVRTSDDRIFKGMKSGAFYFMHSYHFVPEDRGVVIGTTQYGELEMVSSVRKDNIVGVQFHPEKSQGDGMRFIRNFLEVVS